MAFKPVDLVHPKSGGEYTARSAVDLNDRLNEGFVRAEKRVKPSPTPREEKTHDPEFFAPDAPVAE